MQVRFPGCLWCRKFCGLSCNRVAGKIWYATARSVSVTKKGWHKLAGVNKWHSKPADPFTSHTNKLSFLSGNLNVEAWVSLCLLCSLFWPCLLNHTFFLSTLPSHLSLPLHFPFVVSSYGCNKSDQCSPIRYPLYQTATILNTGAGWPQCHKTVCSLPQYRWSLLLYSTVVMESWADDVDYNQSWCNSW